jgi:hypothetical protein
LGVVHNDVFIEDDVVLRLKFFNSTLRRTILRVAFYGIEASSGSGRKAIVFSHFFSVLSCGLCSRQSSADNVKRYIEIEGKSDSIDCDCRVYIGP